MKRSFYTKYGKRIFDLLLTLPGLVIISPLLGFIAILVRWKLGKPVIFRQQRPGLHGKPFTIYKFRTMTDKRDENGNLLPDKDRMTRFGRFLRSTSLDELPELWNVIKGDMSLVGPRPLRMEYLPLYTRTQARRHEVLPGITGLSQISGRNQLTWEEKFELDILYVDDMSLILDIKIILKTFVKVLKRDDINAGEETTMPKFKGTERQ